MLGAWAACSAEEHLPGGVNPSVPHPALPSACTSAPRELGGDSGEAGWMERCLPNLEAN